MYFTYVHIGMYILSPLFLQKRLREAGLKEAVPASAARELPVPGQVHHGAAGGVGHHQEERARG